MERIRSLGAMLITEPTEQERLFEMAVRLARAEVDVRPGYVLYPTLTIRANNETGEVYLAASMKSKKVLHDHEEDGA